MSINLSALMKQRYDTAANWTAQNPTLLAGEIGIESDTKKWKVGTGATAWTSLVYAIGGTYPIVNADIAAGAAIVDTKLATIATAGKVSNSATTAASANTASAIVARDASGNFTAGTITAALTGAASSNVLKAGDTMTGVLAVTAGTAALPGIAVSGDLNTGIYSPGADQVAISTNGTEKLIVKSDGKVGIGTSSPSQSLTAVGNVKIAGAQASNIAKLCLTRTDKSWSINNETDLRFYYGTGDTDSPATAGVVVTSAGRVGIGTTVPSSKLHVINPTGGSGTTEVSTIERDNSGYFLKLHRNAGSGNAGGLIGADSAGTYYTGGLSTSNMMYIDSANSLIQFFTNANERARLDSSGRLLVGGSPDSGGALLQVFGDRIRIGTAKTPASATATGTAGEICWDANYIYVCTATNTWKRTAISTW